MSKFKKTIRAGKLYRVVLYNAPEPRDGQRARAEKSKLTTEARKRMNDKTAKGNLKLLIATNFTQNDLYITLTYRDENIPKSRAEAESNIKKFIRKIRNIYRCKENELKYIYVTENKHGESRHHHHIIINSIGNRTMETICSMWIYGDIIEFESLKNREYYQLAEYMAKESSDRKVGKRMWTGSRNLKKPTITRESVPNTYTLSVPPKAKILESEEKHLEYGDYYFIEYILTDEHQHGGRNRVALPGTGGRERNQRPG